MSALLELRGVTKRYPRAAAAVLDALDLAVAAGESVAVVGPSGCGKSTLLNLIGLLDRPTSGQVWLDGVEVTGASEAAAAALRNRRLGFVFQAHHLMPQLSALENALLPTLVGGDAAWRRAAPARAAALLRRVGLGELLHRRPGELSGGQCQRVAVVRALVNEPAAVLADEPTGSLDRAAAGEVVDLLVQLQRERGLALVVATHAAEVAARMGRVVRLHEGRAVEGA